MSFIWKIREKYVSLQQIIKAPPFFLEWTWPSEDGFFSIKTLVKVIYFTASPLNPEKSSRQSAFLNANKLINGDRFEVVRGKYLDKQIQCPNCHYAISRPEEKKTDVNISVRMIADCVLNATDTTKIKTDTDLCIYALDAIEVIVTFIICRLILWYEESLILHYPLADTESRLVDGSWGLHLGYYPGGACVHLDDVPRIIKHTNL